MVVNLRNLTLRDLRGLPRRVAREPRQAVEAWRQARKVASENGLNALKILAEQTLLERLHGINRYSYYLYRLFEPGLSWEDKKSYLVDDYYSEDRGEENVRLWSLLAPEKYRGVYDNKLVFNRFFGRWGSPSRRLMGSTTRSSATRSTARGSGRRRTSTPGCEPPGSRSSSSSPSKARRGTRCWSLSGGRTATPVGQ